MVAFEGRSSGLIVVSGLPAPSKHFLTLQPHNMESTGQSKVPIDWKVTVVACSFSGRLVANL